MAKLEQIRVEARQAATDSAVPGGSERGAERIASAMTRYFARIGYAVVVIVVFCLLLELVSRVIAPSRVPKKLTDLQKSSPVFAQYDWAAAFWLEETPRQQLRRTYVPFRLWGLTKWHGQYVNNDESATGFVRRTIDPVKAGCTGQKQLWVFGGSTVYGTGVPDFATMPSYLSRDLNAGNVCLVVTNFGVEGYVSNQELLALVDQLKVNGPPDTVIFYDGLNDSGAAQASSGPPEPHFEFAVIQSRFNGSISGPLNYLASYRLVSEMVHSLRGSRAQHSALDESHDKAVATLDNYEANLRVAQALSRAYNFKFYCFWQPSLYYGHKPLVPFEQKLPVTDDWGRIMSAVYEEAANRATKKDFVFLGDVFDSVKEPLYLDQGHLAPRGNELVAAAIAKYLVADYGQNVN